MNAIPPTQSGSTRIVIADDHVLVAQGLERLLMECFHHVDVVSGGQALLEFVRDKRPDLVISDLSMPDLSGLEVMRQLHREDIRVPFVFLTMHGDSTMAATPRRSAHL